MAPAICSEAPLLFALHCLRLFTGHRALGLSPVEKRRESCPCLLSVSADFATSLQLSLEKGKKNKTKTKWTEQKVKLGCNLSSRSETQRDVIHMLSHRKRACLQRVSARLG
uniref:Putative secreted protein n=1 Tax=Ixodes ricinus TaxID=34613 RepID=A0A6B0UJR0_IXORI